MCDGVGVWLDVRVCDGVLLAVAGTDDVGVPDGVPVCVPVSVGVRVGVPVSVLVMVGVFVGVPVRVLVPVSVLVRVGVPVGVPVAVFVAVCDGVSVPVDVCDPVWDGVSLREICTDTPTKQKTTNKTAVRILRSRYSIRVKYDTAIAPVTKKTCPLSPS